jgi:integrase
MGSASRDAAQVSVLAYAGLRPGEALALPWGSVGERLLLIEQSASMGHLTETKTGAVRTVRLLAPVIDDLAALRAMVADPAPERLVFSDQAGAIWTESQWRNWRRRVFKPAALGAGAGGARPYDLRHSFVSLLIAEGRNVIDVPRQAGHSPTMTLQTYGHVFDESTAPTTKRPRNASPRHVARSPQFFWRPVGNHYLDRSVAIDETFANPRHPCTGWLLRAIPTRPKCWAGPAT